MRIHILSNSLKVNSGFSNVAKNIAKGLIKLGHEVQMTGMQTAYLPEHMYGIEILPIETFHIDELSQFIINVERQSAEIVLCIFQADADLNSFAKAFIKTAWYVPIEGTNIPLQMGRDLQNVIYSGGEVIAQTFNGSNQMAMQGIENIPVIYHGFDPDIFKPSDFRMKDREVTEYCYLRTEMAKLTTDARKLAELDCYRCKCSIGDQMACSNYKEEEVTILKFQPSSYEDIKNSTKDETIAGKWVETKIIVGKLPLETMKKFTFGFVGQNFGVRKRIERLIRAYQIFASKSNANMDKTILHLHTMPISIRGINLIDVVTSLGIASNVIFSYGGTRSSSWSDQAMNVLYNTFDCNVSASSGEGFGLPIVESMACGIPNIGPNFSSFIELIGKYDKHNESSKNNARGLLAELSDIQMIQDESMRCIVSERDLSNKMQLMFSNNKLRDTFSKNAVEFTKKLTWDQLCKRWEVLFEDMSSRQ